MLQQWLAFFGMKNAEADKFVRPLLLQEVDSRGEIPVGTEGRAMEDDRDVAC